MVAASSTFLNTLRSREELMVISELHCVKLWRLLRLKNDFFEAHFEFQSPQRRGLCDHSLSNFFRAQRGSEWWQHTLPQPREWWCSFIGSVGLLSIILTAVFHSTVVSSPRRPLFYISLQRFLCPVLVLVYHTISLSSPASEVCLHASVDRKDGVWHGEVSWWKGNIHAACMLSKCIGFHSCTHKNVKSL